MKHVNMNSGWNINKVSHEDNEQEELRLEY